MQKKMSSLNSPTYFRRKQRSIDSLASFSEPTFYEASTTIYLNSATLGADELEDDFARDVPFLTIKEFTYKWEVFTNLIGLYSGFSKERFKINTATEPYLITGLEHLSSYLTGYTGGIAWEENESTLYAGNYYAYIGLAGILTVWNFTFEKSNSRYVNAQLVYNTYGTRYE